MINSARISHKILKKLDEVSREIHRECARDHYQIDKARRIHDEYRATDRPNFPRICEKCGLGSVSRIKSSLPI